MAQSWVFARARDNLVVVVAHGWSEKEYEIEFQGADSVKMVAPEPMQLYAIPEMAAPTKRLFVFRNNSSLEMVAESFAVRQI